MTTSTDAIYAAIKIILNDYIAAVERGDVSSPEATFLGEWLQVYGTKVLATTALENFDKQEVA